MSDKTSVVEAVRPPLSELELKLTQRIQRSFPRGEIPSDVIHYWNSCSKEELTARALIAFGQKSEVPLQRYEVVPDFLPVWRKFHVGGKDKTQLRDALEQAGREVGEYASRLLDQEEYKTSPRAKDVLFAKVNLGFLGFQKKPTTKEWLYPEFFVEWSRKHLMDNWVMELCEPEDGPSIAYQFTNQPNGEILCVAHEPLLVEGHARVFRVGGLDSGHSWLNLVFAKPGNEWHLDSELLLRLRKVQASLGESPGTLAPSVT
ncbi:MAG: hypothetical protein ABI430_01950 [Candidatus Taylorbacteria bacterium]